MLTIYALAALPFFAGGLVVTLAISRLVGTGQRGLRGRPDRRGRRLPDPDSAARSARCAGRRPGRRGAVDCGRRPLRPGRAPQPRSPPLAPSSCWCRSPASVGPRRLRRRRHQGAPGRPHAVQQVEFVLANRRLRADARRLVAQPRLQGPAARDPVHGHRLGGIDADPAPRSRPCRTRSTCATS